MSLKIESPNRSRNGTWDSSRRIRSAAQTRSVAHHAPHSTLPVPQGQSQNVPNDRPATARRSPSPSTRLLSNGQSSALSRAEQLLPTHIRAVLQQLTDNLKGFRRFNTEFQTFTNSEMHAASLRLDALTRSQETFLTDLASFTVDEWRFHNERIHDLSAQLRDSLDDLKKRVETTIFLSTTLNLLCNIIQAREGFIFLFGKASSEELEHQLHHHHHHRSRTSLPSGFTKVLTLISHVSTEGFDAFTNSSAPPEVLEVCKAVCTSQCAVNLKAESSGPPRAFQTLVASPIIPAGQLTPIGVVCVLNKIGTYEPQFSQDDECRVMYCSEQVAECLQWLPHNLTRNDSKGQQAMGADLTPAAFQQYWSQWSTSSGTREAAGSKGKSTTEGHAQNDTAQSIPLDSLKGTVNPVHRDPMPKQFIFRANHNGALLNELHFRSRLAISPAEVLVDVLARYRILEKQLVEQQKRLSEMTGRIDEEHREATDARRLAKKFEKQALDMQAASERVIRLAFLNHRQELAHAPQKGSSFSSGNGQPSTALVTENGSLHHERAECDSLRPLLSSALSISATSASNHHPYQQHSSAGESGMGSANPWGEGGIGTGRQPPPIASSEVVDISIPQPRFIASAQRMRNKAFFPKPPGPWNSRTRGTVLGSTQAQPNRAM